jgi:hypothetical protein
MSKDYYTKFNLKNAQSNPNVLLQSSPDDFKKYTQKFKQTGDTEKRLNLIFFSEENVEIIQKQLILYVFEKTNKNILVPRQDPLSLKIVMKYFFNEAARFMGTNYTEQVAKLNNLVTHHIGKGMLVMARQHVKYVDEISKPREMIPLPINVNKTRNLPGQL